MGRGPFAGPVSVCVVSCSIQNYSKLKKLKTLPKAGLDSKKLKSNERENYSRELKLLAKENKLFFSINHISNKIIDSKGLTFSINKAMQQGINKLKLSNKDSTILLDGGLRAPKEFLNQKTIIKGDEKEKIIAWASILAKVSRDAIISKFSKNYPNYGFESHKGYGTLKHRKAILKYGPSPIHRLTFCKNIDFSK